MVHGEVTVNILIGSTLIRHTALVAGIEEDMILGMDIMNSEGFDLDFKRGVLKINGEEVVLQRRMDETICVILASDTLLPRRSEVILNGSLDGAPSEGSIVMFDPRPNDGNVGRGIAVGKALVRTARTIPVRIMNANDYPLTLRKGAVLGYCTAVSSIVNNIGASKEPTQKCPECPEKLLNLLSMASVGRNTHQQKRLSSLIGRYQDIFDMGRNGRTNIVQHRINIGASPPIRQSARRLPLAKREEADRIIQDMEREGVIEPSNSPWASPVVLVRKKDGSTRFCVDYRQLNNVTKKDSFPLPRIDDTLDTLAGSKIFSTLDLKSGYWQVEMAPKDREKTAFTVGTGLWQFNVMPFGLCNAPATFERLMETVLRGLNWKTCLVYLDDIIVVGKSFDDHLMNLEEVFQRLRKSGLKLSPKKCHLFQKEVQYLGHIVSSQGVAVDKNKVSAVQEWPVPSNKHEVQSFLGMCTYYRRYVASFANIAKPLTRLTEADRRFHWGDDCQEAFNTLKVALTTAPILSYPLSDGKFILDTDASNVGLGAVLSQIQDGQEKVIGYFSKTLSKPERNYCVTRRELLAVIKSVEHFYKYLYGRKFLLRTDHAALQWLLKFKNPEGQVARWIERLQEYDFETQHRAGHIHCNADTLSRRPCPTDCKHCQRTERKEVQVSRTTVTDDHWRSDAVKADQGNDDVLKLVIDWKRHDRRPAWGEVARYSPAVKTYWAQWNSLLLVDDLLQRHIEDPDGSNARNQIVIPRSRVPEVLREVHNGVTGGHLGVTKTLSKLRERFYWANCKDDVKDWCRKCVMCAASNGPQRRGKAPMRQYNVGSPFERIAIDVAGPFPETDGGNKYIIVVMDYFSKWVEAYALPNQVASTVADALVKDWICRFGVPLELHSDQGRNFESSLFQNVCKILNIRKTRTTALHPQSDGMVERMNRTINRHLAKVVSDHQRDWDKYLHLFMLAYRSAVQESTGQSPASIVMGRELRLPCDLMFGCPPAEDVAGEDYGSRLRQRMNDIHERVRLNIQTASDRMKQTYDIRAAEGGFQPGDRVWLHNPQRRRGYSPKLQNSWEGPYTVMDRINDVIYRVQKPPRGKPRVVHFNRLAPYAGDHRDAAARSLRDATEGSYSHQTSRHRNSTACRFRRSDTRSVFRDEMIFRRGQCGETRRPSSRTRTSQVRAAELLH